MGKSTAAGFFRARGARIADTDQLTRDLTRPGQPALSQIKETFGSDVISPDGSLRREKLADVVFGDSVALKKLEAILHPRIRELWLAQAETWRKENASLGIVVIPLLYETRAELYFDKVVCVACSENARRERLLARGWTPAQAQGRIAAQMPVVEKIARADFVIWTEGAMENHSRQVDAILGRIGV